MTNNEPRQQQDTRSSEYSVKRWMSALHSISAWHSAARALLWSGEGVA
jgi:hypothetical protein